MIQTSRRKPKRSLRWVLALWFFIFAIIPIVFLTFYSLARFQRAMDHELALRLKSNASEINVIVSEYLKTLTQDQKKLKTNSVLKNFLFRQNYQGLHLFLEQWLEGSTATSIKLYKGNGLLLASVSSETKIADTPSPKTGIKVVSLHDNLRQQLKDSELIPIIDYDQTGQTALNIFSPIKVDGKIAGYIQQTLALNSGFLEKISRRMKIQALLLEPNGRIVAGSHRDFALYKSDFFLELLKLPNLSTFALPLRGEPYGFIFAPVTWGQSQFKMVLGTSKMAANATIRNLRIAYYTLFAIMLGVLALSVVAASKVVLHPLSELIDAIHDFHLGESLIELPIKSDNEIGQLTTSFNELSRRILKTQMELKKKITELEEANIHLKDTQGQLVHSAKMASLGQLVAGVAHELNNPIGFIYSNMTPLREYANDLMTLIDCAEKNPKDLEALKKKVDLDFIKKDLPRLISSCEDGARRTKDIVLGLRNFSRIEENVLSPTDIHSAIDNTLNLLNSEFKNRIEVTKDYSSLPPVTCNPTQINQVLMNILSNAAQAIKGNGRVWITTRHFSEKEKGEERITISIQDNGPGIPDELLQRIFDPFFTTKAIGQGTGLGLAISYGIIQSHGGTIEVHSQVSQGTEFIITLPLVARPANEEKNGVSK